MAMPRMADAARFNRRGDDASEGGSSPGRRRSATLGDDSSHLRASRAILVGTMVMQQGPQAATATAPELYQERNDVQIVDVREPYEWEAGHIEGAIHIPLMQLMSGAEQGRLDPAKPVVAVCRAGNRSELATTMLQARGYDAQNLEGGMEAWAAAGLPFSASDGTPGRVA